MNEKIGTILSIAGGLALLVVLLLASACSAATSTPDSLTATPVPPTSTPTPAPPTAAPTTPPVAFTTLEDIAGRWESGAESLDLWVVFSERGRFMFGVMGSPYNCPAEAWFDGGQLHLKDVSETCGCDTDDLGIYEVQGVPGEFLNLTVIDEPCRDRRGIVGRYQLAVSP